MTASHHDAIQACDWDFDSLDLATQEPDAEDNVEGYHALGKHPGDSGEVLVHEQLDEAVLESRPSAVMQQATAESWWGEPTFKRIGTANRSTDEMDFVRRSMLSWFAYQLAQVVLLAPFGQRDEAGWAEFKGSLSPWSIEKCPEKEAKKVAVLRRRNEEPVQATGT
eukprot:TRINITY_DN16608_c0_g1_i9.p1 TRINITY_DN16608_c0_g1~~TRINITY_DN16608_c0_g1_i9.p1  ORF type:complete len:166 (-),score=31.45 TRINITY_DN16608_c0_g1_i9:443-940(-)